MRNREVKIGVAPYSDGSGYRAEVRAYEEDGQRLLEINMSYRIETSDWPALKKAVEDAIALVEAES